LTNRWKNSPRVNFPVVAPDPEKIDIKYLTYPIYAGGNRGRQVYPTGDKSNMNVFGATQAGITEITIGRERRV
jgi:hypothetical protein